MTRIMLVLVLLLLNGGTAAAAPDSPWWMDTVLSHSQTVPNDIDRLSAEPAFSLTWLGRWDEQVLAGIQQRRRTDAHGFWSAITLLGDPRLHVGYALAAALRDSQDSPELLWSIGLTGMVTGVGKIAFGQARPHLNQGPVFRGPTWNTDYAAMPSAHTAVSFAAAAYWTQRHPDLAPLFYGTAGLIGFSRLVLEEHWPSNVLVGAVLGLLVSRSWLQRHQY